MSDIKNLVQLLERGNVSREELMYNINKIQFQTIILNETKENTYESPKDYASMKHGKNKHTPNSNTKHKLQRNKTLEIEINDTKFKTPKVTKFTIQKTSINELPFECDKIALTQKNQLTKSKPCILTLKTARSAHRRSASGPENGHYLNNMEDYIQSKELQFKMLEALRQKLNEPDSKPILLKPNTLKDLNEEHNTKKLTKQISIDTKFNNIKPQRIKSAKNEFKVILDMETIHQNRFYKHDEVSNNHHRKKSSTQRTEVSSSQEKYKRLTQFDNKLKNPAYFETHSTSQSKLISYKFASTQNNFKACKIKDNKKRNSNKKIILLGNTKVTKKDLNRYKGMPDEFCKSHLKRVSQDTHKTRVSIKGSPKTKTQEIITNLHKEMTACIEIVRGKPKSLKLQNSALPKLKLELPQNVNILEGCGS